MADNIIVIVGFVASIISIVVFVTGRAKIKDFYFLFIFLNKIRFNLLILIVVSLLSVYPSYLLSKSIFYKYFNDWGEKLVNLENRGLLSKEYGAGWQYFLLYKYFHEDLVQDPNDKDVPGEPQEVRIVDGVVLSDYPSISIIKQLRDIRKHSNTIEIVDRFNRPLAKMKTEKTNLNELPPTLITALIAAEDKNFYSNALGIEFKSSIRSLLNIKNSSKNNTLTITERVAKFILSKYDENGIINEKPSIDTYMRQLRLAVALRKYYSADDILDVYLSYLIKCDQMTGYKDISKGLFNKNLNELSDAECVYLARIVKLGKNNKNDILIQCKLDMKRMGAALHWDQPKIQQVLSEIKSMSFSETELTQGNAALVDLANETWLLALKKRGVLCHNADLNNPNSIPRISGNIVIKLNIDKGLQELLEEVVNSYDFRNRYYAFSIMDSRTGKLLAYVSRDKIGSRLAGLLKNRFPNGSSTATPIFNSLNYDLDIFKPYSKWSDAIEVPDDCAWKREFFYKGGKISGAIFHNSPVYGKGYQVYNHENVFHGCQYIFDLFASSNNILAVESLLRLNNWIFDSDFEINPDAFQLVQLLYRNGSFNRVKDTLKLNYITGVRIFKELARNVGVNVDYFDSCNIKKPLTDKMYTIALGTMKLSLYEQMHLFNILYNNDLIEQPANLPSLLMEDFIYNGKRVIISDTIRRYHPFIDINNIRPTILGMHKIFASKYSEGNYDIAYRILPDDPSLSDANFNPDAFLLNEPLSNFSANGSTHDFIKLFNENTNSNLQIHYSLLNSVIRVNLSKFSGSSESDIRDLTISCISECAKKGTEPLIYDEFNKILIKALLSKAGIKHRKGFFSEYEQYIKKVTPPEENCNR